MVKDGWRHDTNTCSGVQHSVEGIQLNIAQEIRRYSLPSVLGSVGQAFRVLLGGRSLAPFGPAGAPDVRPDLDKAIDHIVDQSRRVTFGSDLDSPDLYDLDIPFSELVAPFSDQQLVDEYLSTWAGFAFGCDPSEVSALQVLTCVAGYDNTTWTLDDAPATKFALGTASLVDALAEDGGLDIELSAPGAWMPWEDIPPVQDRLTRSNRAGKGRD